MSKPNSPEHRLLERAQLGDLARWRLYELQLIDCPECVADIAGGESHREGCQVKRLMLKPPDTSDTRLWGGEKGGEVRGATTGG